MKVKVTKGTGRVFEFFLYSAIIVETGMAAFVYKMSSGLDDFFHLRTYLAVLYFAFLAWCMFQLNKLHRMRREFLSQTEAGPLVEGDAAGPIDVTPQAEALPQAEAGPVAARIEPPRLVLGLTGSQFMVVLVVFVTALVTFSWALTSIRR
jgi:hypothetical protein